ncbi:hypothetical protein QQ045_019136 [Rhodiola kirilowii]
MEKRAFETESIITQRLPEDVLRLIFSYLDDIDLKSTSLVCKLLCSLSSPFVRKLTLRYSYSDLQRLFKRFPGVTNIHIHDYFPKLNNALLAISNSDLKLQSLHIPVPEVITIANMSTSKVINSIKSLQLRSRFYSYPQQSYIEASKPTKDQPRCLRKSVRQYSSYIVFKLSQVRKCEIPRDQTIYS